MYDSFCNYQAALLAEFERLGEEYKFEALDASADADTVCAHLKKRILSILEPKPQPATAVTPQVELLGTWTQRVVENLLSQRNIPEHRADREVELVSAALLPKAANGNGRAAH
jgi:hypothetical protein